MWTGLGCATALCLLRPRLERLPIPRAAAVAIGAIVVVVALVSQATLWLGDSALLQPLAAQLLFPTNRWRFLLTNIAIGAIVGALALRYFYVLGEWQRNVELQAQARVHALQARIRPHFLYNSMNTIAALTRSNPAQAEEAVQDLADLFRASLTERGGGLTLREEVEIARTYERIERLRLGERLRVHWDIDMLPQATAVPSLLLQPLLENAIYHGIEPRREGGLIHIVGRLAGDMHRTDGAQSIAAGGRIRPQRQPHGDGKHPRAAGTDVSGPRDARGWRGRGRIRGAAALSAGRSHGLPCHDPRAAGGRRSPGARAPAGAARCPGGCELVGECGAGDEAVRLAGELRPDVVLLDVRMPGMSGLEAARHMALLPSAAGSDLRDRL